MLKYARACYFITFPLSLFGSKFVKRSPSKRCTRGTKNQLSQIFHPRTGVYYRIKKSDKAGCAQMKFRLVAEKKCHCC